MAELITLVIDIALGALAYRLAFENRKQIEGLREELTQVKVAVSKAGLL